MEEGSVLVNVWNGKGVITINRPKVLNAIDWDTFFKLQTALDDLIAQKDVRVIILTGSGEKAFISGGDIGEELKMDGLTSYRWSLTGHKLCATIEASPKPVIAAVNGYCLGGGFEFALACDFRICSENAKFGAPESKLGVCCGFGGNIRLPRIVGKTKAKEMLMTGKMIDAREAWRINLVNEVVSQENLMGAVDGFCAELLNKSATVLDFIKRAVDYGTETDRNSAAQYEAALFGVISATEDKKEGMGAFMEKRLPVFQDR
ncbi:enoyl-CoA hydratase-related protein [Flavonifractor sp. DFI.6.63]|uniref:enoyl-CoA hydratase/isomerase family protein n=1 Tax=Flavonifractor sp. DFI.6.63 TaxID=2963704 RepID=UPI00210DA698|nr:enoyl-CoA hydratase-related protein [Flavonifractor sp. DFI.6.63]MCQ5030970.1 enoyl-CoA hydratase-related protein [Flavonifractor sp. DFI.6.63]